MIDPKILAATAVAFDALDFTPQNDAIAAIRVEMDRLDRAVESARARWNDINAELAERRQPELQARALADALVSGVDAAVAVDTVNNEGELRDERDKLREALRELSDRKFAASQKLRLVEQAAFARVQEATKPLIAALDRQTREAAEVLLEAYTTLCALSFTAHAGEHQRDALKVVLGSLFEGRLALRQDRSAPPAVDGALSHLKGKCAALPIRILPTHQLR
ncbi:MAG TPA: hypothetical protein VHG29_00035 [Novosphingobium sp.]|nr:hypothetical protein [Novosphingobium sp.]